MNKSRGEMRWSCVIAPFGYAKRHEEKGDVDQ